METDKIRVSIVIPNYNGIEFISNCLKSLENQTYPYFQVIVMDNASTDGSQKLILKEFNYVILIQLDKNYGFCKAVNEGIKISNTKYVILLNNDTVVDKHFVEELVKVIEKSPKTFSCSAKMLQLNQKELIDDAGDFYCALGWAFARGKSKSAAKYNQNTEIFASCAGAAIYRKAIFERLGYFDEAHFAYLEDIDIGYRAKIHGFRNEFAAKSIVYHAGSGSSGSRYNEFKVKLASRNSIYLIYKNMPMIQIILNFPLLLTGIILKTIFFTRKGFGTTYINGIKKGINMAKNLKKVEYKKENFKYYVLIQLELWINVIRRFIY